jgi:hypothetical protein
VVEALKARSETPITVVGEVTETDVVFVRAGEIVENLSGWDHFAGHKRVCVALDPGYRESEKLPKGG